ncbi:MAG: D-glycero-beta-D-manno-heptose-7-phosphate kinase [Desulfobacca sp.]|uniref:D-glycero-beta-D-manno-heptose-7-phosphate kinase n=1 Tax=Desulfobacca sp. TaxID=2067990 RepID=UPI00404AB535
MIDSSHIDLQELAGQRLLVAGDFMLDEYIWGQVERISPEAPVLVVNVQRESRVLGGAGNVVNNLVGLGAQVSVLGLVGQDDAGSVLTTELHRLGVETSGLVVDPQRRTTRKTRVIGGNQQIVRIDRENRQPAPASFQQAAQQRLADLLPALDGVILSDYGKGVLTAPILTALISAARDRGLPVVVDPKGRDFSRYRRATIITPNLKEAAEAVGYPLTGRMEVLQAGRELCALCETEAILITLGPEGMALIPRHGQPEEIPAQAREVFDVSGAGDTVVAVLALALARWHDLGLAARLANLAAGIVVGKVGTAPILRAELAGALEAETTARPAKIVTLGELLLLVPRLRAQGKRLVLTNGCFDLLHWGHVKFLEESRRLGDILIVALDSDDSVRRVKGPCRPVIRAGQRAAMLAALEAVDFVTVFTSEQLADLLQKLQPDILTKGSNYPAAAVKGREVVASYGGQVITIPITDPVSITGLIRQICQNGD